MTAPFAPFAPFAPISRRSLADDVRAQLEVSIRNGTFGPGALIPSEESLCREFGVSRTSVREAIRDAILLGLVERRANRVYVVEHLPAVRVEALARTNRIREVFETRRLIEVELTQLAAARATKRQRNDIAGIAAQISRAASLEQLRPLDRAFHSVLAAAAGNALMAELHTKVLEAVFSTPPFDALLHDTGDDAEALEILSSSAAMHATIAAAVVAGDVAAAGAASRAHLDDVERRLLPSTTTPRRTARRDVRR